MTTYFPINCGLYDYLESFATQKQTVRIVYQQNQNTYQISDMIQDLITQNHEEYLVLKSGKIIRLDQLMSLNEISFAQNSSCQI